MSLAFDHTTNSQRILFGAGKATENVVTATNGLSGTKVLLVADASARSHADALAQRIPVAARIDDVVQHVPVERARVAREIARQVGADVIVTIGGGSATGLGKAVSLELDLPIIAVPTTFAGSEATDMWGMTDGARKTTGTDLRVLPKVVVYDVKLVEGLPPELAISSGLNALAHAVDSLWAPRTDPINEALASAGMAELIPALRALAADGSDRDARESLLYGAYVAAVAFASAGAGMHHKICHVLGGAYALPHAPMHAVLLPYVAAFNAAEAPRAAELISRALDGGPAGPGLRRFAAEIGAPTSLRELGLRESDLPQAARLCADAIPASNVRPVDAKTVESILRSAWEGADVA